MSKCIVKSFSEAQDYNTILELMKNFTQNRSHDTLDQIWLLEHKPIYTYGAHTTPKLPGGIIPAVKTDRGGNITYHAPGQIILYPLIDTRRLKYSIHGMVERLEQLVIIILESYQIKPKLIPERRGVYVGNSKIASIGLRFKKYCSYHGLALNVNLDLKPFSLIEPCGYQQETTSLLELGIKASLKSIQKQILQLIPQVLELEITEETICQ